MLSKIKFLIATFAMVTGIGGCTLSFRPIPNSVIVTTEAPRPIVEVRTVNPGPEYIWIDGYWGWSSNKWVWSSGRWETSREGYYWVQPHNSYSGGHHYYAKGGWTQSNGYATSNNKSNKKSYSNGKSSKGKSYNSGKSSKNGYKAANPKCPKGYVWSKNACRSNSNPGKTKPPKKY